MLIEQSHYIAFHFGYYPVYKPKSAILKADFFQTFYVFLFYNLGKEMDLQYHIIAVSSNFAGFNIFIKKKTYRTLLA